MSALRIDRVKVARTARAIRLLARLSTVPVSVGDFVHAGWSPIAAFTWFRARGLNPAGYTTCREAFLRGAPKVAIEVAGDLYETAEPRP